ncbi:MAG TPA: pitrilysin family protein [Planctomycetota bacterium]|nr:pitrilysin family protein [Planctomycetota bacterium]
MKLAYYMKAITALTMLTVAISLRGAEPAPAAPEFPADVQAALAKLEENARPIKLMAARSGALYCMLPNGCEIIVMEKHSAPVAAVQAWVRTGAMHEGEWMGAGLSHFCEHMLFKGTNKRPPGVLDQEIRGAGGDDNAYTTSERTVYHITTQREGLDTSFNAMADMLMDSTFPEEETKKEHAVVVKEIERYQDSPDAVLWEGFEQMLYQVHPYRVPVLGYPDRFKKVTHAEVFAYYKQRYSPQLCTFIAVGDFDAARVMPEMAKELAKWERKSVAPVVIPEEPEQVAPRRMNLTHPLCEVPKLIQGFPTVSIRHPDLYALDVLANVLGDGRASRLYQKVKDEQNLVFEISAFNYTPQYKGWFGIFSSADEQKLEAAQAAILKVIEDAKTNKPTEAELARAKRKVYTQHVFARMTAEGVAGDLGSNWFVAGDLDFSDTYNENIQKVTAEDCLRVAKQYLIAQRLNTAVMRPALKAEAQAAKAQGQPDEAQRIHALQAQLEKLKARPEAMNASLLPERGVFEFSLKSGIRVIVKEDKSLPVAHVCIAALGGLRWEPAQQAGAANLMAESLDRGTQKRTKLQIAEQVEGLGASLASFSGRNSFGINVRGLKPDLPALVELAADSMLNPKFDADEFAKLRDEVLQQIAQEDESLRTLNSKVLRPLLYGDHPYSRQVLGTIESVAKIKPGDLKLLHQNWVQPENLAISFVGDVSALEALDLVQAHFGQLKPAAFKPPAVPQIPQLADGKKGEAQKANITGAVLSLAFPGVNLKHPDREALDLMGSLLSGLGGRLFVSFREKEGLSYEVGAYNDTQLDGGAFVFFVQTDEKSLDRAIVKMWEEVKRLRDEKIADKELVSIRNYLAGTEAIEQQNQGDLAQRLALSQLYGEGAAHVFSRKERLEKLSAEKIQEVARKYLDEKRWAQAIVKPMPPKPAEKK